MSTQSTIIDWHGVTLSVKCSPEKYGLNVHHLEVHVLEPKGARLPITDTGYRSHFFSDHVEDYGGPVAYVKAWLDEAAGEPDWIRHAEIERQLKLF